jgi:hypothetical protein
MGKGRDKRRKLKAQRTHKPENQGFFDKVVELQGKLNKVRPPFHEVVFPELKFEEKDNG